jgi:hypothetical protein
MDRDEGTKQEMLNRVAAIQAAAEILHDNGNMPPHERRLFLAAISQETARLSRLVKTAWAQRLSSNLKEKEYQGRSELGAPARNELLSLDGADPRTGSHRTSRRGRASSHHGSLPLADCRILPQQD